jgi:DNA gyrase/topoisomerase IV subunit A
LAELKKLDAGKHFSNEFKGTKIPTLEEVFQFLEPYNLKIITELKGKHKALDSKVSELIKTYKLESRVIVSTYNHDYLHNISTSYPDVTTEIDIVWTFENLLTLAKRLNTKVVCPIHYFVQQMWKASILRLKFNKIKLFTYTVNTKEEMLNMIRKGVDGIMTDKPQLLLEIKNKYSDPRRTKIEKKFDEIDIEDLIQEEEVAITITHAGYIKRIPLDTYRSQKRGGKGIQGLSTREDDFVEHLYITSTHHNIIFFTNMGRAYKLKAYEIPEAGRTARGTNIVNILPLNAREKIQAVISIKEFTEDNFLLFVTRNGITKKTPLVEFSSIRKNGLNTINLRTGDELIGVKLTDGKQKIVIITQNGYSISFDEDDVRSMGRTAAGVKGITLRDGDIAVSMEVVDISSELLVVSENGFGKRTSFKEYSVQGRGGKGIITYKVTGKTGKIVGAKTVKNGEEILLINNNGIIIRLEVSSISRTIRNTMGVTLMRTRDEEKLIAIAKVNSNDDEPDEPEEK